MIYRLSFRLIAYDDEKNKTLHLYRFQRFEERMKVFQYENKILKLKTVKILSKFRLVNTNFENYFIKNNMRTLEYIKRVDNYFIV